MSATTRAQSKREETQNKDLSERDKAKPKPLQTASKTTLRELCELLKIHHLKTSPYHPQTDGCLEHWHSTQKCMLRTGKQSGTSCSNICFLPAEPHPGFSPFEILYGRPLRSPLDVLRESWLSGDLPHSSAVEWVDQLREKLCVIAEAVKEKEGLAKESMKRQYDKHAVDREFEVGIPVLVRTPDLQGKLADLWDGPYEIIWKISPVTYELAVPHRRSKSMVSHINRHNLEAAVMRVVIAEDEIGTDRINRPRSKPL